MTDKLNQSSSPMISLNSINMSKPISVSSVCTSVSGDLKTKTFFTLTPDFPKISRTPGGNIMNPTNVLVGTPPKDRTSLILLPISNSAIIRRRSMITEQEIAVEA